jgi:hypothetical protein
MKAVLVSLIGLFLAQSPAIAQVRDVDLGISIADGKLRGFYLALGEYYRVPPRQMVEIRDRYRFPDEELPVVYFLAARAHVDPSVVINLRIGKMSWLDITFRYGLTPDIFFVPISAERIGPPYGNAYGYYRKYGRTKDWKKIVLSDREVVDLVNLRFMSEHYKMSPDAVIAMRGRESRFVFINDDIRQGKNKAKPEQGNQGQTKPEKGNQGQNGKAKGAKNR